MMAPDEPKVPDKKDVGPVNEEGEKPLTLREIEEIIEQGNCQQEEVGKRNGYRLGIPSAQLFAHSSLLKSMAKEEAYTKALKLYKRALLMIEQYEETHGPTSRLDKKKLKEVIKHVEKLVETVREEIKDIKGQPKISVQGIELFPEEDNKGQQHLQSEGTSLFTPHKASEEMKRIKDKQESP